MGQTVGTTKRHYACKCGRTADFECIPTGNLHIIGKPDAPLRQDVARAAGWVELDGGKDWACPQCWLTFCHSTLAGVQLILEKMLGK